MERDFRILKGWPIQQHAPRVFEDDSGYIAFHRHSDGVPVAVARSRVFVGPPEGTYPAPITRRDYDLYRCTLPEVTL